MAEVPQVRRAGGTGHRTPRPARRRGPRRRPARSRRPECRRSSWRCQPVMNCAAPPVLAGKPMPKIEPMLASAVERARPRRRTSRSRAPSTNVIRSCRSAERDLLGGDRERARPARARGPCACRLGVVVEAGALAVRAAARPSCRSRPCPGAPRHRTPSRSAAASVATRIFCVSSRFTSSSIASGADREARLRRRPLDRDRVHALGEHRDTLEDQRAEDPRGEEAAAVVDDDRCLAGSAARRRRPWPAPRQTSAPRR